jgi:hypothetical protein
MPSHTTSSTMKFNQVFFDEVDHDDDNDDQDDQDDSEQILSYYEVKSLSYDHLTLFTSPSIFISICIGLF